MPITFPNPGIKALAITPPKAPNLVHKVVNILPKNGILPNNLPNGFNALIKPNLFNAKNTFGQEWDVWLANGYIDWAVPMNYSNENRTFESNLKIIQDNIPSQYLNRIIMGIGAYNQNPRFAGQKIYRAGKYDFGGISIFSYTVFKEQPNYAKQLIKYLN